jgi:hypothetical protein
MTLRADTHFLGGHNFETGALAVVTGAAHAITTPAITIGAAMRLIGIEAVTVHPTIAVTFRTFLRTAVN